MANVRRERGFSLSWDDSMWLCVGSDWTQREARSSMAMGAI